MKCYLKTKYLITALLIAVFTLLNSSCDRESRSEINKIENKDGIFFVRNYEREEKMYINNKGEIIAKVDFDSNLKIINDSITKCPEFIEKSDNNKSYYDTLYNYYYLDGREFDNKNKHIVKIYGQYIFFEDGTVFDKKYNKHKKLQIIEEAKKSKKYVQMTYTLFDDFIICSAYYGGYEGFIKYAEPPEAVDTYIFNKRLELVKQYEGYEFGNKLSYNNKKYIKISHKIIDSDGNFSYDGYNIIDSNLIELFDQDHAYIDTSDFETTGNFVIGDYVAIDDKHEIMIDYRYDIHTDEKSEFIRIVYDQHEYNHGIEYINDYKNKKTTIYYLNTSFDLYDIYPEKISFFKLEGNIYIFIYANNILYIYDLNGKLIKVFDELPKIKYGIENYSVDDNFLVLRLDFKEIRTYDKNLNLVLANDYNFFDIKKIESDKYVVFTYDDCRYIYDKDFNLMFNYNYSHNDSNVGSTFSYTNDDNSNSITIYYNYKIIKTISGAKRAKCINNSFFIIQNLDETYSLYDIDGNLKIQSKNEIRTINNSKEERYVIHDPCNRNYVVHTKGDFSYEESPYIFCFANNCLEIYDENFNKIDELNFDNNTFSRFDYIYFDNDYFIIRNDKYYLYKIGKGFVMKDYEYISIPQGNYFMCYDGNDYILMDKDLNKICLIY